MVVRSTASKAIRSSVRSTLGSGGGAGGGWPTLPNVANLWIHHDLGVNGDALNSISPETQATDGQTLRRVLDRSGNAYDANQATGLNQPLFESSEYTRAAARFDGTNDFLDYSGGALGLTNSAAGITCFLACRYRSVPSSTEFLFFASTSGSSGSTQFGLYTTGGKYVIGGRRLSADTQANLVGSATVTTDIVILTACVHYADSSALIRINGEQDAISETFLTTGTTDDTNSLAIAIGGRGALSAADIDVFECLVYKDAVSLENIGLIETYLASKHQ